MEKASVHPSLNVIGSDGIATTFCSFFKENNDFHLEILNTILQPFGNNTLQCISLLILLHLDIKTNTFQHSFNFCIINYFLGTEGHPDEPFIDHMKTVWELCVALWGTLPDLPELGMYMYIHCKGLLIDLLVHS